MSDEEEEDDVILVPPSPSHHPAEGDISRASSSGGNTQSAGSQRTLSTFVTSQSRPSSLSTANQIQALPGGSINQRIAAIRNVLRATIRAPPLPVLSLDENAQSGDPDDVRHGQSHGQLEIGEDVNSETTGSDVIQIEDSDETTRSSENTETSGDDVSERRSDMPIFGQPHIPNTPTLPVPGGPNTPSHNLPSTSDSAPQAETLTTPSTGLSHPTSTLAPPISVLATPTSAVSPSTSAAGTEAERSSLVQLLSDNRDSPADFRSPKRRRVISPEKSVNSSVGNSEAAGEDDADCCPICFDDWTTSGSHRLSSLKCGHLFGQSCIEKWLKGQGGKCPHCNAKAKRQDIRVLYAKSIKAVDTTERDRALQDLEKEREARRKAEMEAAQSRLQFQIATEENNRLKTELDRVRQQLQRGGMSSVGIGETSPSKLGLASQLNGQFVIDKTIKIWEPGNCRVMAYSPSLATLVVSQPSASPLFPGFGIKKISAMDFKTSQYLTIHSKAIRDVCFHPLVDDGILLSCGLDKTIKMTSVISNTVVQSYDTQQGVWSCIWNWDDRNYFYAGQQNGRVLEFDVRNTTEHVQELNTEGSRSPIVSLQYIPQDPQASFRPGGLLVGQLDRISFFERKSEENFRLHMLPLEGNLTSLSFEPVTRHILASFRPTARHPTSRHQVCELVSSNISTDPTVIDNACTCHIVHTFHGGRTHTVLSRSTILPHPQDNSRMMVCAGEETTSMIHVWDSGTGQLKQRLHAGGVVVDICSLRTNEQLYLTALTEKHLRVMKWN